ncbi:MAG: Gfo/Idh/MocA family oxidoreductase [Verrucomicrobiota bacterium]
MPEQVALKNTGQITRRRFAGGLLQAALLAAAAPNLIPLRVLAGETTPSKKIQLGHIGVGGQGTGLLKNFLNVESAASVAVCDPFRSRRENAGKLIQERKKHEPKLYNDFRDLLADKSVDAVVIATPDHWHVPIGLAAVRAGKDVYIEKPLGHSLAQNQAMLAAVKKNARVFQYGTQQRSGELLKRGVELVLNGYIGELQRLEVWAPGGHGGGSLDEIPVPDGLDYELYIGPAPMKPCTKDRITSAGSWYCSDYALGFIAGWGAHPLDIAIWGMDSDTKGPVSFHGTGAFPTPDALFNTCATWDVDVRFHDGITMRFMSNNFAEPIVKKYRGDNWETNGTTFFGTNGWISLSRNSCAASNPEWFKLNPCAGGRRVFYRSKYSQAFVDSVRERSASVAPIEDALRSDAISHLSLMAVKSGREVRWDPKSYKIISPGRLNKQMSHPIRSDWIQS